LEIDVNKEKLIAFENDIAECFNNKLIRAPIHLADGNEEQLIKIFESVKENDWIFCTWRSHYHALLKGVPEDELKQAILEGRSITLCFEKQKMFSSAIVGGSIPIALGTALDLKIKKSADKVWCFVGDMGANMGAFHETVKYAENFDLPITFVIENNSKSVCTNTYDSWGTKKFSFDFENDGKIHKVSDKVLYYSYDFNKWKHAGTNVRVQF
jgi:TPP-dependent pyruvate/acetoin dehydrogenase alpha subunit